MFLELGCSPNNEPVVRILFMARKIIRILKLNFYWLGCFDLFWLAIIPGV